MKLYKLMIIFGMLFCMPCNVNAADKTLEPLEEDKNRIKNEILAAGFEISAIPLELRVFENYEKRLIVEFAIENKLNTPICFYNKQFLGAAQEDSFILQNTKFGNVRTVAIHSSWADEDYKELVFSMVLPGGRISAQADITDAYHFMEGRHNYRTYHVIGSMECKRIPDLHNGTPPNEIFKWHFSEIINFSYKK